MRDVIKLQSKVWELTRVGKLLMQSIPKQSYHGEALRKNDRRTPQLVTFVGVCQGVPNLMQDDGCANSSASSRSTMTCVQARVPVQAELQI